MSFALQLLKVGGGGGLRESGVREGRGGKVGGSSGHTALIASEDLARWRSCLYRSRSLPALRQNLY